MNDVPTMTSNCNVRAWQTDWSLRVECYDEDLDCCDRVRVTSSGVTRNVYPEIMEEYLFYTGIW